MPQLAAFLPQPAQACNVHLIRELAVPEFEEYRAAKAEFMKLRQRLNLLVILEQNFSALDKYIEQLRMTDERGTLVSCDLNRHFMNYLSSAYALRQHLETWFKRDLGRESLERFRKFLALMEEKCFAYAFFQDFRNYVQHCGFPVFKTERSMKGQERLLALTYPKAALLHDYANWEKARLTERTEHAFDLVVLVRTHQKVVHSEFPVAILAEYGKNFDKLEACFLKLQAEAGKVQAGAGATIVVSLDGDPTRGGQITFDNIPQNPLAELGLSRKVTSQLRQPNSATATRNKQ